MDNFVNFDMDLSDCLIDINLTRRVLFDDPGRFILLDGLSITNGVVFNLEKFRNKEGLPFSFTFRWLQRLLHSSQPLNLEYSHVKRNVDKLVKLCKNLQKRKDSSGLSDYCNLPYVITHTHSHSAKSKPVDKVQQCSSCDVLSKTYDKRSSDLLDLLEVERAKCNTLVLQCNLLRDDRLYLYVSIKLCISFQFEISKPVGGCSGHKYIIFDLCYCIISCKLHWSLLALNEL